MREDIKRIADALERIASYLEANPKPPEPPTQETPSDPADQKIGSEFSMRARKSIYRVLRGIYGDGRYATPTYKSVSKIPVDLFWNARNCGKTTIEEIQKHLSRFGLSLAGN